MLLTLTCCVIVGCAAPAPVRQIEIPVFPPPPDEPRFYYEKTLTNSADIKEMTSETNFRQILTGTTRIGTGFGKPFSVAVHRGRIFVSDTQRKSVMAFDAVTGEFFEIGTTRPGELSKPAGLDVDKDGNLFVCDNTLRIIQHYDRNGKHIKTIGRPNLFVRPSGLAVDRNLERVYVVDNGGVSSTQHQVLAFDMNTGEHQFTFGGRGGAEGKFNLPREVAVGDDGMVYVVDSGNFRVQVFDTNGDYQRSFGTIGITPGNFARPKGIALDGDGNVYVSDTSFGNFQIFNSAGELLLAVGNRGKGRPATFMLPAGVEVDEDGRVYMVDQYSRKVDIFRPATLEVTDGYLGTRLAAAEDSKE